MKKIAIYFLLLFLAGMVILQTPPNVFAESNQPNSLKKTMATDLKIVDGNRIFNYINNSGAWVTHNCPPGYGMQWPGESHHSVNYASGIWVAGKVDGTIRTAASEFAYEFQPGPILADGTAAAPDDPIHSIYKINKADLLNAGADNPDYNMWISEGYKYGAPVMKTAAGIDSLDDNGNRIPALIGDQMLWMVYNDLDAAKHSALYGTDPIGMEVQNWVWVFNRPDEFGDMMFVKFILANKGDSQLEDAYVGLFFDIDLGDAGDDLCFCDTTLSLGGFWNDGDDTDFPIPPAVGADFFQGPIVPSAGDTANLSGTAVPGYKNLGMTSFSKFIKGGPVDAQDPENGQEVYNFMSGLNGLGQPIIDPISNTETKFVNVSDPESGTGWVDGVDLSPDDRRMLMNTGPFTLEKWVDTDGDGIAEPGEPGVQEVVVGWMIAQGTSAANSVTRLKQMDQKAQLAYDSNFALPPSPPTPQVTIKSQDEAILLMWDGAAESYIAQDEISVDEEGNPTLYEFQGYNVYQANAPVVAPGVDVVKLATYDLVDGIGDIQDYTFSEEFGENVLATVQRADDAGVQRFIRISTDALRNNTPLRNWNKYWFIVTAYGYNEHGIPAVLESPLATIEATPMPMQGGVTTQVDYDALIAQADADTAINATHTGPSQGVLQVIAKNPSEIVPADYQVSFHTDDETGETYWQVSRDGEIVVERWDNQEDGELFPIVDGMQIKMVGPPLGISNINRSVSVEEGGPGGERWVSGRGWGGRYFFEGMDIGANFWGSTIAPTEYVPIEVRFTDKPEPSEENGWSLGYVFRRDLGYAFEGMGWMPMQSFDISDPANPRRLNMVFVEDANNGVADLKWNPIDSEDGGREYTFFMLSDYTPEGGTYSTENDGTVADVLYALWPKDRSGLDYLLDEFWMRIEPNYVNSTSDVFSFSTVEYAAEQTAQAEKEAVENVNVFPNPYMGQNRAETRPLNRFVTFTHLAESDVTIRIMTLAGDVIRIIDDTERESQGTFGTNEAQWDLRNKYNVPVASGIYIAHVDMGDRGVKVLKLAVFMPEERLDLF